MTQSVIITLVVAIIMYFLAYKDHKTFKNGQHINYKHIIVSLGVLGTFIGIVWGLWNFNTQNIGDSVPQLLEGLKLAFLTSILGMGTSIFLSVLQAKPEVKTNTILLEIKQQLEQINQTSLLEIKQQLEQFNQTFLLEIKQQLNQTSLLEIKQQLEQLNQTSLNNLYELKHFQAIYQRYQQVNRFQKIDSKGQVLPELATEWVAVQDNDTGLIWEVKTNDGKLQDSQHTYTLYAPDNDNIGKENGGTCQGSDCDTLSYVMAINTKNLAGYDDWRLPTIEELEYLLKGSINKDYFPHIQPDWYSSATPYSDDSFWCIYFTNGQRGHNKYGYGHLMLVHYPTLEKSD